MKYFVVLVGALLSLTTGSAVAEDTNGADMTAPPAVSEENVPAVLSGTLKKVRDSGEIAIGYREASFPFSYVGKESLKPLGYSVDLCQGVVEEIARELSGAPIRVVYSLVTSESRIEAVSSGKIDLECGSTTGNIERQKSASRRSCSWRAPSSSSRGVRASIPIRT